MTVTWPLPASYNIAFGEASILLGALFLAAAFALSGRMRLESLSAFALLSGLVALLIGVRIAELGLTNEPASSATGFVLAGIVGLLAAGGAGSARLRASRPYRLAFAAAALLTAVIWALTGFGAYWDHLATFTEWQPR